MNKLSNTFVKMLGFAPRYMRPPYGAHNAAADAQLAALGFRVVALWDIDSADTTGTTIAVQKAQYTAALTTTAHIGLQHDPLASMAAELVPFLIQWAHQWGLNMVTLGECIGDPQENWYTNQNTGIKQKDDTWACEAKERNKWRGAGSGMTIAFHRDALSLSLLPLHSPSLSPSLPSLSLSRSPARILSISSPPASFSPRLLLPA